MKNKNAYDVIILGAGASGLMCAGRLNQQSDLKVAVIEGNPKPAAKLKISGGGKCNITNVNVESKYFLGDSALVERSLHCFSKNDLLDLLQTNGLNPVIRKERYYFCPKSSDEIITILKQLSRKSTFLYNEKILSVEKSEEEFSVLTDKSVYRTQKVIVATGGVSFTTLGASNIGLQIAKQFDHTVTPFLPALVGLTLLFWWFIVEPIWPNFFSPGEWTGRGWAFAGVGLAIGMGAVGTAGQPCS